MKARPAGLGSVDLLTGQTATKGSEMKDAKMKKTPAFMMKKGDDAKGKGKMPKFAKGGYVRSADGVATKGKTRAMQVKMAGGGKC